ncbi:class I lanthipeptide [Taibaiella koreensis]|uniref:class I lanthipeptide n=1 Tax=Taibaiella koreensis TaxID=1268548 RepID=UPI000E5A00B8|nr:class I lanthipeptide [Taibaiella koreensis]
MKKKNLTAKLSLKKKNITQLTATYADHMKGGNSATPSCVACIPPTEPEGCSNGCPSINNPAACRKTIAHQQTQCCHTWVEPCSVLIPCIG